MDPPRVSHLANSVRGVADAIHAVLMEAYRVEAAILGVADFAPLRRTAADISASAGRFLGISVDGTLAAVAELEAVHPGRVHIASLAVRPSHFRRGLAAALLRHVTRTHATDDITVSTAAGNGPALSLYASHGFREQHRWSTSDGVAMVSLRRHATAPDGVA